MVDAIKEALIQHSCTYHFAVREDAETCLLVQPLAGCPVVQLTAKQLSVLEQPAVEQSAME